MKILGHCVMDEMFWPLNFILLLSRRYILWSTKKELQLNIYFFQTECFKIYQEQRSLYQIHFKLNVFDNRWNLGKMSLNLNSSVYHMYKNCGLLC